MREQGLELPAKAGRFLSDCRQSCRLDAVEEKRTIPISVVALRAERYSAGDGNIVVSLRAKYSAERQYSIPVECFEDLIVDLRRLSASVARKSMDEAPDEDEPMLPLEMPVAAE
jgi:hypothetical protein